jgi:hypothetical protein
MMNSSLLYSKNPCRNFTSSSSGAKFSDPFINQDYILSGLKKKGCLSNNPHYPEIPYFLTSNTLK